MVTGLWSPSSGYTNLHGSSNIFPMDNTHNPNLDGMAVRFRKSIAGCQLLPQFGSAAGGKVQPQITVASPPQMLAIDLKANELRIYAMNMPEGFWFSVSAICSS